MIDRSMIEFDDGRAICVHKIQPFDVYLQAKGVQPHEFMKLGGGDKEKAFLRWKHGMTSDISNHALQQTSNEMYGEMTDEDIENTKDPYEKKFLRMVVDWERKCHSYAFKYGISGCIRIKQKKVLKWEGTNEPKKVLDVVQSAVPKVQSDTRTSLFGGSTSGSGEVVQERSKEDRYP